MENQRQTIYLYTYTYITGSNLYVFDDFKPGIALVFLLKASKELFNKVLQARIYISGFLWQSPPPPPPAATTTTTAATATATTTTTPPPATATATTTTTPTATTTTTARRKEPAISAQRANSLSEKATGQKGMWFFLLYLSQSRCCSQFSPLLSEIQIWLFQECANKGGERKRLNMKIVENTDTVDGRNPAAVDTVNIPLFAGFLCIPDVAGFLNHQQYHTENDSPMVLQDALDHFATGLWISLLARWGSCCESRCLSEKIGVDDEWWVLRKNLVFDAYLYMF